MGKPAIWRNDLIVAMTNIKKSRYGVKLATKASFEYLGIYGRTILSFFKLLFAKQFRKI